MKTWKVLLGGAAILCVGGAVFAYSVRSGPVAAAAPAGPPAMPVPVAAVVKKTIPVYLEYSARTESIREVSLQAKVAGYIQSQPASDGADVKGDELLYNIHDRDYRAALDQAKAQAQRNVAALSYARSNFNRGDELVKTGFLAKDNYDQRASTLGQSEGVGGDGQCVGPFRRDQSGLYRNPRAVCRPARPQPGARGHAGRRLRLHPQHPGAA